MSVLDELVAGAVEDQRSRENNVPLAEVKRMAFEASAPIDARQWLKKADGIPVIAEIKRASPSKGHLSDIPDPAALAREYEQGGASAISVLTEGRRFLGSLDDFDKVRAAVQIPVLRKDFIVTEYQILGGTCARRRPGAAHRRRIGRRQAQARCSISRRASI